MQKEKANKKTDKRIKTSKIINNFLVLFFLFIISLITFPRAPLNSYNLEKANFNGELPRATDRIINLFSKPKEIKTEIRDYSMLEENNSETEIENNNSYEYLGSFSYTASNFDLNNSTLRFDYITTGISFYPDIYFEEIDKNNLSFEVVNKFDKQKCLKESDLFEEEICINSDCLKKIGNELFFNNLELQLPFFNGEMSDLSISNLDNNYTPIVICAGDPLRKYYEEKGIKVYCADISGLKLSEIKKRVVTELTCINIIIIVLQN